MKSIPVTRFAALMHDAEAAVKANDLATLERINAEIEQIGYRVIVRNGETLRCMPFDLQPIVRVVTPQEAAAEPERKYVLVELNVCTEVERVVQQDGEFVAVVFAGLLQKPIKEGAVLAEV